MGDTSTESGPRYRRACEPCRRKKTRCTGEKPTCSFCNRLKQPCTYITHHEDLRRVQKAGRPHLAGHTSAQSQDRLQRLEERLEQMATTIAVLSATQAPGGASSPSRGASYRQLAAQYPLGHGDGQQHRQDSINDQQYGPTSLPSGEVMAQVLAAYREHASALGLSIGGTRCMRTNIDCVRELPEVVQRSLLALAVRFTAHYHENALDASSFGRSAMHMLIDDATPRVFPESRQECIVLLVHADILESRPAAALMKLNLMCGSSGRGSSAQVPSMGSPKTSQAVLNHGDIDLAVLLSIYGGPQNHIPSVKRQLLTSTAASTCCPPAPMTLSETLSDVKDPGIWSHMMTLKLSWGRLVGFLNDIRVGTVTESLWNPRSTYYELMAEIYEFEISCLEQHRLSVMNPEGRSTEDLAHHCNYWNMWFCMQMLYHAYQALLNHPLLLLHIRSHAGQSRQPPSFMQHSVDQAILHAGWVCRMSDMWNATGLKIADPFIGYLVGAAATVHFLLCYARDESVVEKATENFGKCCTLLSTMSLQWKHLTHTKAKLDKLEQIRAEHATRHRKANLSKLSSEILWNLLDYSTSASEATTGAAQSVDASIDTIFLSPLAHHDNPTPRSEVVQVPEMQPFDDALDWEALGFTDEPGILFPVELWTNGQL